MLFNPPLINHIDEVLPHIKDNPAFIVVDRGWYKVIDYVWNSADTFNNDIARECRGLKFDARTGLPLARPYHKFHNLGECAGYRTGDIDLAKPHHVLDKLDGSMIHTCINPAERRIYLMTRMGHTDHAKMAEDFLDRQTPDGNGLGHKIANLVFSNPTKTFIFEYVGPNNRIVIPYEREELIMTGIRDIYTGEYTTMALMAATAAEYDIPCVGPYIVNGSDYALNDYSYSATNPDQLMGVVALDEDAEGCVVRFETGAMVKMKSAIYCRKHKSKEMTETNKGVIQLILDNNLDDVIPQLDDEVVDKITDYEHNFLERVQVFHEGLRHILSLTKHMEQKEFALHIQATYPVSTQKLLFSARKSEDSYSEIVRSIKKRYNKEADLVAYLKELDFPLWLV